MSKIGTLTAFIRGMHVMSNRPEDGLRDYHAARRCINAGRKRDIADRCSTIKAELKNYRVTVVLWQGDVEVRRTTDADGNMLACPQSWHLKG